MNDDLWIIVPNWAKFQHYKDRTPRWIKQYSDLVHRDEYLELSPTSRALLHGIWSLYALADGVLRAGVVPGELRLPNARPSHWDALTDAGFIQLSASKPLALRALAREEERREEKTRVRAKPKPRELERRAKAARAWLANVGTEIPADHLPEALVSEFKLPDELVANLLEDMP